jgi:hypothetical protein
MCNHYAFALWLYDPGDEPVQRDEPEPETADERVARLLKELGYNPNNPLTEKGWTK